LFLSDHLRRKEEEERRLVKSPALASAHVQRKEARRKEKSHV